MTAGLVAGSHGINNALSLNRTDLATIIAERELERIGAIAAGMAGDPEAKRKLSFLARHGAVLATLCQGLTLADARKLIKDEAARLDTTADINATVTALRNGLPGTDGQDVAPILPDIVGEAGIMYWLGDRGVLLREFGIDPLGSVNRAAAIALERTSLTLVRTAQDFVAAELDEPVGWLRAIAQARKDDLDALATIADALPYPTLALLELAAGGAPTHCRPTRDAETADHMEIGQKPPRCVPALARVTRAKCRDLPVRARPPRRSADSVPRRSRYHKATGR